MNLLGKSLVFVQLVGSLFALTWAAGIFLQQLDWGWKEPRKDLDVRVPSEIDKRSAAVKEAQNAITLVYPAILPARNLLTEASPRFPENHLWYLAEIERLRNAPDTIDIKEVKFQNGNPVLDTPGKPIGKPVLEELVPNVNKSNKVFQEDLKMVLDNMSEVTKAIGKLIEQEEQLTQLLNGYTQGKMKKTGLLELVDREYQAQVAAKFEMEYLRPMWAGALEEASNFRERRDRLQSTLDRLGKPRPVSANP